MLLELSHTRRSRGEGTKVKPDRLILTFYKLIILREICIFFTILLFIMYSVCKACEDKVIDYGRAGYADLEETVLVL